MNDMNELTNKLQQVMVPKAALIAYEYRENRYGNGMHYLELHPINDRGRMEAAMPVTYEFMDSLVESYTDDAVPQAVEHIRHGDLVLGPYAGGTCRTGKSPPTCCGVIRVRGTRGISGTILRENGRCSLPEA